jgi:hypothetical protein
MPATRDFPDERREYGWTACFSIRAIFRFREEKQLNTSYLVILGPE